MRSRRQAPGAPGPAGEPPRGAPCELQLLGPLPVLAWPVLDPLGAHAVVTTRGGGTSTGSYASLNLSFHVGDDPGAVLENRRRVARAMGVTLDDLVLGAQVHGSSAAIITEADRGRGARGVDDAVPGADALVTDRTGIVLVTLVADCVPIVLFDPVARVLATVHAGWRGTTGGVAGAAVEAMTSLGAHPDRMVAGIGPAVSPADYQVGPDVAAAMRDRLADDGGAVLAPDGTAHWLLDLPEANRRLLVEAGITPGSIHVAPLATGGTGHFYSDRAARPCGRFALLARITAPGRAAYGGRPAPSGVRS